VTIGTGQSPHLASKRSGGGVTTEYGIGYSNQGSTPWTAHLSRYQGRAATGGLNWNGPWCGLDIDVIGEPFLGRTLLFSLDPVGSEFSAVVVGFPAATPTPCGGCEIGVDLARPVTWSTPTLSLRIPGNPAVVGLALAVQGFASGTGNCQPGALRLSETVEVVVQ
jgi:hypothetical protein